MRLLELESGFGNIEAFVAQDIIEAAGAAIFDNVIEHTEIELEVERLLTGGTKQ